MTPCSLLDGYRRYCKPGSMPFVRKSSRRLLTLVRVGGPSWREVFPGVGCCAQFLEMSTTAVVIVSFRLDDLKFCLWNCGSIMAWRSKHTCHCGPAIVTAKFCCKLSLPVYKDACGNIFDWRLPCWCNWTESFMNVLQKLVYTSYISL
jgi:hypothetical protein